MTPPLFVLLTLLATVLAVIRRGTPWTFARIYIPFILLVPSGILLEVRGLTELSPQRAVTVGIFLGSLLSGRIRELVPSWRKLDLWMLAIVLSYSVSFGLATDLKGFFHRLVTQSLDWGLPYLYARTVFRDLSGLRAVLPPLAICGALLGCFSLYEARMNDRLLAWIWNALLGYPVPDFWQNGGGMRWGFLRAFGPYPHPLVLGTILVACAPLALGWSWLDRKRRLWSYFATSALCAGVLGPISRGPILALGLVTSVFSMAAARLPALILTGIAALAGAVVFSDTAQDLVESTEADLAQEGNTESGKYRLALLMIYVEEIPKVGMFGDESVIGANYQAAWSIDNSFLFMYMTGGWLGGSLFLVLVAATCIRAYRALLSSSGVQRKVRACIAAAFTGLSICIANVWFATEIAALCFPLAALVWNQATPGWYGSPARPTSRTAGAPPAGLEASARR
ncbi:MAG: hypothetical protein JNK02_03955 [Planctomycetes bacterium]|nr:hypothetical protein [Planctomycetota bacterium]